MAEGMDGYRYLNSWAQLYPMALFGTLSEEDWTKLPPVPWAAGLSDREGAGCLTLPHSLLLAVGG